VVESVLKLRVFVADKPEAKAVQGYIASCDEQVPAPVLVLCPRLPMAIEYDPRKEPKPTPDSLTKKAKRRAVTLVRDLLRENKDKLSSEILSGHAGHSAPVSHLAESLERRFLVINPETKERGIFCLDDALQAARAADVTVVTDPRPKKKSKVRSPPPPPPSFRLDDEKKK